MAGCWRRMLHVLPSLARQRTLRCFVALVPVLARSAERNWIAGYFGRIVPFSSWNVPLSSR